MLGLGIAQVVAQVTAFKEGLRQAGLIAVYTHVRGHAGAKEYRVAPCSSPGAEQGNLRKEHRLGDADVGVGGDEVLFSLPNIRPALKQRRGQARRQLWRQRLSPEGPSSRNALWVISEKNAERILGLTDLALQVRDLRIRSIEQLPGLKHVKPCGDTVFKPQLGEVD